MPKIRQLWDFFVQAESSSYEKSSWCDLFLSQFIVDLNDGKTVDEILTFCNWSGVGTLIGCELLSDINQVCSQPGDGEDLRPLRHHLYIRGWRALTVLISLGHQSFSCSNELANLLISLFPICLETKENPLSLLSLKGSNKYVRLNNENGVDSCFTLSPFKTKFSGVHGQLAQRSEYFRNHNNITNGRNRRVFRGGENQRGSRETQSSESENPCDDLNLVTKSCALKIKLDPMDFDYYTSVVRSEDEARLDSVLYEPRRRPRTQHSKKIMPADMIDEKIKDVLQSQVSPFEFSMLVIQLLILLCKSEQSFTIATENSYPVCLKCVKFSLENLCSLQFGSVPTQILENREAASLKSSLTQLLVISLEKVMGCPDVTTNVILTGILPMMLRVLEDSVCKLTSEMDSTQNIEDAKESYEREKQQEVIFGLICSAIKFLFSFLMQNSDADRVRNFLELFKIFIESNNGKLIEKTVMALSKFGSSARAKKVIDLIGQLVTGLKKLRKEMVNPHSCKRFKHKKCKSGDEFHHHHDLFGAIFTATFVGSNYQQNCCVSSLFLVLVRLLKKADRIPMDVVNRTLKVMTSSGTCCCFQTKNLLEPLVEIVKVSPQKTRVLVFQLLENTLYPELGLFSCLTKGKVSCVICSKQHFEEDGREETLKTSEDGYQRQGRGNQSDHDSENSFVSHHSDGYPVENRHFEKSTFRLDVFQDLLSSQDIRIVQGATCHLLKCAPKMNPMAKSSVLFRVFLPLFLTSKSQFFSGKNEISIFRILSSLSVFSSLLNNFQLAKHFISQKGLNHVLDLISVPLFARHCCSVLEKTILLAVLTPETNVESVSSLTTLRMAVDNANAEFFKHFREIEDSLAMDIPNIPSAMGLKRKTSLEKKDEKKEKKVIDVLENVCTFWRSYANLTLCSPILRKYFTQDCFLSDCNNLLKISLSVVTNKWTLGKEKCSKNRNTSEACLITKLIESLLTFILATTDYSQNEGKDNNFLMEQLSHSLLINDLRNVDVRRLAEVLMKCSLVQPSQSQVIPSDAAPKLLIPPLWCSWGDVSEVEGTEGEGMVSESESLEDNYVTADEGYEADVEIKDSVFSPSDAVESKSLSNLTDSITFLSSHENEFEKNVTKGGHVIVHPKLCLLAIDLLIKLYQEKVIERVEKNGEGKRMKVLRHRLSMKSHIDKEDSKLKETHLEKCVEGVEMRSRDSEGRYQIGLISIFQRLVSLCRDKNINSAILCRNGVIMKVLMGFRTCLIDRNDAFSELQKTILDLVTVLAKHSITPEELSLYLSFFKHDNPPLDHLLEPLLTLVTCNNPQPNYTLRFPVPFPNNFIDNSITDFGKTMHVKHKTEGIISSWSSSALSVPIGNEFNWAVWSQGFSLSIWLKIEKTVSKTTFQGTRPKSPLKQCRKISKAESHVSACSTALSAASENHTNEGSSRFAPVVPMKAVPLQDSLHIFSLGNEALTLECWTSPDLDILIWRLTKVDVQKGYETIAETTMENCLTPSLWSHVAINVKDSIIRKKTVIEVCLIINGGHEVIFCLPFSGILIRRYRPSSLLIGAQSARTRGSVFVSTLMLFTTPVFNRERAVYLLALGPNCTHLTDCQIDCRSPNFTWVFPMKNLITEIDWEGILDAKRGTIRELQTHLLIIYSAENPHTFTVYPSNYGTSSSSLFSGLRLMPLESRASQQTPIAFVPCIFASLDQYKHQGLIPSAIILGGSSTFLFLFARVVELSNNPDEQAKYLLLLLKLVQSDCDLFSQFINNDHHAMLHQVFVASRCASGLYILKAILDACCDKPIVQNSGGKFQVIQQSDAIIVNSFLITTILSSWKDWSISVQENEVLGMLFSALHTLLKDEHPYREFNVAQLNRVEMVNGLLSFCKERLLYDDKKTLKPEVCLSLVELVKSLMGAPPEFSHVVAIMDCLILLHPVHATYVTHVRSSFYILLSAGQTYCTPGKIYNQKSKSANLESDNSKHSSHQFLDNWIFNFNFNTQVKRLSKHNSTQTVDPSKLNKALANLQLKQSTYETEKVEEGKSRRGVQNEELDSNRYSDDLTFDSGIAGSYREVTENVEENEEIIVKAVDGSQQNLNSFFPSTFGGSEGKANSFAETVSDEEDKYYSERKEMEGEDDYGAQCIIVEGLLLLLRDIILVLPDSMAQQVLNHVVKLETLLVMANHRDPRVRSAVVKVFSSYLQRSSEEEIHKFVKLKGFYHLANQISLFPASQGLVEDCLQLLTRCSVSLEDHNFISQHELNDFGTACLPPLLALLPRSVHDLPLAHNLINLIRLIYCKDEYTSKVLLESGLLETLVKTLVASAHFSSSSGDGSHQDLVLLDIFHFFIIIVNQVLNTPGFVNMQIVSDIRLQLNYVYRLEKENCGAKSRCVRVIRDTLCKIYEKGLDILHNKIISLQNIQKPRSSIFSSVLNGNQVESAEPSRSNARPPTQIYTNGLVTSISPTLSQYSTKEMSRGELSDRFKSVIVNAVEFLVFTEKMEGRYTFLSQTELNFIYHLLPMLLQILSSTLEKRSLSRLQPYSGIYWTIRDTLKAETSELVLWLLSPKQMVKTRMFAITTLMAQFNCKNILSLLLQATNQAEQKFTVYLWDLMYNNKLASSDLRNCQELKESLQQWEIVPPHAIGNSNDAWGDNCNILVNDADRQMSLWEKQLEVTTVRCITKHELLVKGMSEDALTMTRLVVDAQNTERKSFMEEMKIRYSESIQMSLKWNRLISELTHERAVWFFEKCYPLFWQLDPTEGPSRVRKRLTRCHLNLDERYFMPYQRHKLANEENPEPLSFLFDDGRQKSSTSMVLIERLHCNEKIRAMSSAKIVTPAMEIPGELLIGETCVYFVADDRHKFDAVDATNTAWFFEDIREIHNRRYELQEKAIEIFLLNGKTYFVAFDTCKERDGLMAELLDCDLPNKVSGDNMGDIMQLWREGLITNWEYLTHLNKMAGRSYNDLMQYPVYPFVLSDYTSGSLDLDNSSVYRNFKKPMAVQEKKNEQHYINNYNELLGGLKQVSLNKEPYHYGSHYSNSGTVLHFLVRLPPFTKMLLQYQDRNFDLPDRTFHSMHTTWRLASSESTTDVKEMLPEFFFLPEFLINFQGFNFGVRQNGEMVDDVLLPPWSRGDARRFILIHRQALESDYVRENLPHWIDLVFGFKQTGKAAVDAINVFHPATYCGFDVDSIADPVERIAWETMVKTYGQTPKQLLKNPHPLVIQTLIPNGNPCQTAGEVRGLKWGSYVGSPAEGDPQVFWRQQFRGKETVTTLLPLLTNEVAGLPPFTTLILHYSKDKGLGLVTGSSGGIRAALVSWSHPDGIIRIKLRKELSLVPLVFVSHLDPVTTCVSVPGCHQLWMGHSSGNVSIYKFKYLTDRDCFEFAQLPIVLQGHRKAVSHVSLCRAFSVAVSGGEDGVLVIWDLNHSTYVRSFDLNSGPVRIVAVSDTLGDIASVSQPGDKTNVLQLHTINGAFVGSVAVKEKVTSVCFSAGAEGVSINVIACGLCTGAIKLYSTWDLTQVRDISPCLTQPVTSLAYSFDGQNLYASFRDGTVVAYENSKSKYASKPPKFFTLKL